VSLQTFRPPLSRPRLLFVLCLYLFIWVPAGVAAVVTAALPSLEHRGAAAVVELAAHGAAGVLCAVGGWMLWVRNRAGVPIAQGALVLNALVTAQALFESALPRDIAPGQEVPLALVAIANAAGWILYLRRSRRVRAWLDDAG
jgi:hypothetical protein